MQNRLKHELHNVISGKSEVRFGAAIQAITSYLRDGTSTGATPENSKQIREQETKKLIEYVSENGLWVLDVDFSQYVSEGAEQRVYLNDSEHVFKLNDAIYYSSWTDYFYNILFHNYFFNDTAYELVGFTTENQVLYAVVKQSFVATSENTDLEQVKFFLSSNGFINNRNNDYFNPDLGIILEDLHDENVLTKQNVLYFIDTVFYTTETFWVEY